MKHQSLSEAAHYAWNATFIPYHEEIPERFQFIHYFLGFPPVSNTQVLEILLYVFFCGFIFTPLKNIVKLFTEFPLALLHHTILCFENSLKESTSILGTVLYLGISVLALGTGLGYFLVRTITSPVASVREAAKVHPLLAVFSILCSIAGLAAATIALAPAIVSIASSLGLTSMLTTLASTSGLSPMATGILFVLSKLGISASAPMVGAAIVTAFSAIIHTINSMREYCTELLSNPRHMISFDKNFDAVDDPSTWVDMIESGLTCCCRKKISTQKEDGYPLHFVHLFTEKADVQKSYEKHPVLNLQC